MKKNEVLRILLVAAFAFLFTGMVSAQELLVETSVSNPWMIADRTNTAFVKISLTGFDIGERRERTPVNVAIVLDRSGSMDGEKISRAREAAKMAIQLLEPRDIASIIAYSDTVSVLVPATRVTDKQFIFDRIDTLFANGSTALFAGVSKGADELFKFFDTNTVNRVILISDGLANVGPDSPEALGDLGTSLRKMGVSVTTIGLGLGYNEDLMVRLAEKSDGNHAFVENARDLLRIFEYEFGDILSVVAQDIEIEVRCGRGVRPLRVLGRDAEIIGPVVVTSINQVYGGREKYLLLEVEVEPRRAGDEIPLAEVRLRYNNMATQRRNEFFNAVRAGFTLDPVFVEENIDRPTMVSAVMQIAAEKSEEALRLRDEGLIKEAKAAVQANSLYLQSNAAALGSEDLAGYGEMMASEAESIESEEEWAAARKRMVEDQYEKASQQSY